MHPTYSSTHASILPIAVLMHRYNISCPIFLPLAPDPIANPAPAPWPLTLPLPSALAIPLALAVALPWLSP